MKRLLIALGLGIALTAISSLVVALFIALPQYLWGHQGGLIGVMMLVGCAIFAGLWVIAEDFV